MRQVGAAEAVRGLQETDGKGAYLFIGSIGEYSLNTNVLRVPGCRR